MAKKPKAESGSPAKEACSTATEKEQGNETSADQAPSPVCNDDVTTVQNSGVVSAESKVVSGAGKSDAVDDVVDLVSPQGSPSKAQPKQQSEDRGGQEPVAKRQCLRYNEAQTRKLEAFFKLGKETVDFAAVSLQPFLLASCLSLCAKAKNHTRSSSSKFRNMCCFDLCRSLYHPRIVGRVCSQVT